MRCFLCSRDSSSSSSSDNNRKNSTNNNRNNRRDDHAQPPQDRQRVSPDNLVNQSAPENTVGESSSSHEKAINNAQARTFTFDVLVAATQNFKEEYFLGEGGFGKVYKGRIPDTDEIVAVKQLDRSGCQGITEFVVEVVTLSTAHHENLVKLIGYCVEGAQRLLVYEYMPLGALDDHIHDTGPHRKVMDWNTRMKVAAGAARGLEYLHNKMTPPIIYRDLKCSNILLGDGYHPKLSDFGLAKVGPQGDKTHVSTRVMGTYGYCAPEYAMTGQLTYKSDIFSFGVVLLELITGRRAIDNRRPSPEQNLVAWARPLFKDRKKFHKMVDPALQGEFPIRGLYQALAIAAMCVQEQPTLRPQTSDIVTALNYLASQIYDPQTTTQSRSSPSSRRTSRKDGDQKREEDESTSRKHGERSKSEEDESTSRKDDKQIKSEEDESTSRKDGEQSKSEEDESISRKDGEQSKSEEDESTNDPNTTQSRSSPSSRRTSRKEDGDQSKREEDESTKSD